MPIPSVPTEIRCPLCQEPLRMYVTTSKKGRHAIGLVCPVSGKHLRAFINDEAFVAEAISKIAQAAGDQAPKTPAGTAEIVPEAPPPTAASPTRAHEGRALSAGIDRR